MPKMEQIISKEGQKGAHEPATASLERPNGAPDANWQGTANEHGCQKRVQIEDPEEVENRAPAAVQCYLLPNSPIVPGGPKSIPK